MGKGPGLYTDIDKKARGDSSLASFLAFLFFKIFVSLFLLNFVFFLHMDKMLLLFFFLLLF